MKNKNDLKELAETLFIKTNLTKTEIAQMLGISRRTVHYWAADNAWDRLKSCTDNMPSIGTENAWLLLTRYQEKLLAPDRAFNQLTNDEVNNVCKLGALVRKLTKGNALNETIELRNRFMEFVNQKNPEKALEVQSMLDDFIRTQAKVSSRSILLGKLDEYGSIPQKEENVKEVQLDIQDVVHWSENPPQGDPDPYTPDEIKETEPSHQAKLEAINDTLNKLQQEKISNMFARQEEVTHTIENKKSQLIKRLEENQPELLPKVFSHKKLNNLYHRNLSKNK